MCIRDSINAEYGLNHLLEISASQMYPGHGMHISAPTEKIQQYISHRQEREQQIISFLNSHQTTEGVKILEIVQVLYAAYPQSVWRAASHNVYLHLQKLFTEGRVTVQIKGRKQDQLPLNLSDRHECDSDLLKHDGEREQIEKEMQESIDWTWNLVRNV
eukprot:TRINITY_DN211_c0_g1_i1.p1 TRINITY_DN211_c0_g1~~TRINITY_DN211_c0_g1_i1.p1  ORF type:complete len:159 (+),score=43.36 TRINITY_DN211_c0_g1_i1:32-508(+)